MKYDDLVEALGEFGPYQRRTYLISCLPAIGASIQTLISVFILAIPMHRCAVPGMTNDTYAIQSDDHQRLINFTLPWTDRDPDDDTNEWGSAQCDMYYNRTASDMPRYEGDHVTNHTVSCHRWVYDTSVFDNTFITEEDMICGDKTLRSHANMIYMSGLLGGSLVFGIISDAMGRKISLLLANGLVIISSVCLIFSPNFIVFVIIRFVIGFAGIGIFISAFVLAMEPTGRKWRTIAGIGIQFYWCVGMFILDGVAFALRDWTDLQLAMSCYAVVFMALWWLVPESPRWLIGKGRIAEARDIMERVAKSNGKKLPDDAFDLITDEAPPPKGNLSDIFSSSVLAIRTLIIFVNWLVVTLVYYGLTLNVASLGGSVYVNFAISGAVELCAYVATIVALPRLGRKKFHCSSMLLGGVACLCSMIPSLLDSNTSPWVTIILSNVGKFGATGAFACIYVYTAELYPTSLRTSVVGASSMIARIGGMVSPYIADLGTIVGGKFGTSLPYIVFGGSALVAGLLALLLPETLNKTLPETIEDAVNFGKNNKGQEKTIEVHQKYVMMTDPVTVPQPASKNGNINAAFVNGKE